MKFSVFCSFWFLLFLIYSCKTTEISNPNNPQLSSNFKLKNELDYVIFPFDKKDLYYLGFDSTAELNNNEIQKIDSLLSNYLLEYNIDVEINIKEINDKKKSKYKVKAKDHILVLEQYKKQYVPAFNSIGEKVVWINCICESERDLNWKVRIVDVSDGGNCFFNLKINLSTNYIYDFRINGIA